MLTHAETAKLFRRCRNKERGYRLARNTRITQRGKAYAIRLHETDVVVVRPDGTYRLDSGGWRTATTKERMNRALPCPVWQTNGIWHIGEVPYIDGMLVGADGTPIETPQHTMQAILQLKRKVDRTVNKFVKLVSSRCVGRDIGAWDRYQDQHIPRPNSLPHLRKLWDTIVVEISGERNWAGGYDHLFKLVHLATRSRGHGDPRFVWSLIRTDCLNAKASHFVPDNLRALMKTRKPHIVIAIMDGKLNQGIR